MTDFPECEQFNDHRRSICRGETHQPLNGPGSINAYRKKWGLEPLAEHPAQKPLTLWGRAKSVVHVATQTVKSLVTKRRAFASQELIDKRLEICKVCSYYSDDHCIMCGCSCRSKQTFLNKLAYEASECPIGKWKEVK